MSGEHQRSFEMFVPVTGPAGTLFTTCFIVARCHPSPSGDVPVGGETAHINPNLRHDHDGQGGFTPGIVSRS